MESWGEEVVHFFVGYADFYVGENVVIVKGNVEVVVRKQV